MTGPNPGNDEVIRVVYQAVADYSQMLRETRRAREETRALKRDVEAIAGTSTHRVKVTAETAQARAELARVLRDIVVQVKVTVDAAKANAELSRVLREVMVRARVVLTGVAAARAELIRLGREVVVKVRPRLDSQEMRSLQALFRDRTMLIAARLDEAGITARFAALLAHLESLGPVDVDVRISEDTITGIERRLRRLGDSAQGGGGGPGRAGAAGAIAGAVGGAAKLAGDTVEGIADAAAEAAEITAEAGKKATETVGNAAKQAAAAGETAGASLAAGAPMIIAITTLVGALISVIAVAAAAVGTVAAAFVAAGGAAGVFAVAAIGAIAKLTEAVKAYEKSGDLAAGPLGQAVTAFETLKARYEDLQKATSADVFGVFIHGMQIAASLLDKIEPLISRVATAIDTALGTIGDSFSGDAFDEFLDFLGDTGTRAIEQITAGLVDFSEGIGKLLEQFAPFAKMFVDGFAAMGEQFNAWASDLDNNEGFQEFLARAADDLPKLVDLVLNLVAAVVNLAAAYQPAGSVLLDFLNWVLRLIAALPHGYDQMIRVRDALLAIARETGVLDLFRSLQRAAQTLWQTLGSPAVTLVAAAFGVLARAVSAVLGFLAPLAAGVVRFFASLAGQGLDAFSDALGLVGDLLGRLFDALGESDLIDTAAAGFETLVDVLARAGDKTDELLRLIGQVLTAAGKLVPVLGPIISALGTAATAAGTPPPDDPAPGGGGGTGGKAGAAGSAIGDALLAAAPGVGRAIASQMSAVQGATGASYGTRGEYRTALKTALGVDFGAGADMSKYNAAAQAMAAYDAQLQSVRDAEQGVASAQYSARRAQEAVNEARKAAVQRIKDVQRALRDMAVDERQAKLDVKTSDESLAKLIANGGSADEIEQARLDNERAHNTLNDLEQDKGSKKKSLQDELARGVEGNKALQDAVRSNADAQRQLGAANRNLTEASTKLTDLHLAFDTAAGALGLSEDQVRKLKTNMDALKDKTIKVVADTADADAKLAKLLQGQYALQLMATGMSPAEAMAIAAKKIPTLAAAAKIGEAAGKGAGKAAADLGKLLRGHAEGGPTVASPVTAGPVYGPGTGVSDSIAVRLPVGGPARLSLGEHIVTDAEVKAAPGGHGYLEAFRAGLRAGRPWGPPGQRQPSWGPGYAAGGPAWSAVLPTFALPAPPALATAPGYAAGGAVKAISRIDASTSNTRSLTVNVGSITNAVPEPAGASLFTQVRKAAGGEWD